MMMTTAEIVTATVIRREQEESKRRNEYLTDLVFAITQTMLLMCPTYYYHVVNTPALRCIMMI